MRVNEKAARLNAKAEESLRPLRRLAAIEPVYAPINTRVKCRVHIDDEAGIVAALATRGPSGTDTLRCIIQDTQDAIRTIVLAEDLVATNITEIYIQHGRIYVCVVVGQHSQELWKSLRKDVVEVFVFRDADASPQRLQRPDILVSNLARIAPVTAGEVLCLFTRWYPPVAMLNRAPLELCGIGVDASSGTATLIRESDVAGSLPRDFSIFSASDGTIHVVYYGRSQSQPSAGEALWYLKLSASGQPVDAARMIGPPARQPLVLEIRRAPDGYLRLIEISSDRGPKTAFRCYHLSYRDSETGGSVQCLVDYFLQPHTLVFRDGTFHEFAP